MYLSHLPVNKKRDNIALHAIYLKSNTYSTINENDVKEETWHKMTSSDGPLTVILMLFTYKVETYLANSIWREVFKKCRL